LHILKEFIEPLIVNSISDTDTPQIRHVSRCWKLTHMITLNYVNFSNYYVSVLVVFGVCAHAR
jgi:energy-coupling factor transporter transmembrane protein EcfT